MASIFLVSAVSCSSIRAMATLITSTRSTIWATSSSIFLTAFCCSTKNSRFFFSANRAGSRLISVSSASTATSAC
ncbi:MAG: hypothetical protein ACLUE8_01315 [Lachnospiraceae bacterium]